MSAAASPLVWFQILDSGTGQSYKGTSADYVSLPPGSIVAQFRDAVKAKQSNKLSSFDAADLFIYKNKASFDKRNAAVNEGKEEPLKSSAPLDSLGETEEDALIVAVQASNASNLSYTSVPDRLKQLGIEFSVRDVNYILNHDRTDLTILMSPNLTKDVAQAILTAAKSKIKSATQRAIGVKHSFLLDGSLNVGQGQQKSSLYYAFSDSGGVLVAKVYNGHKEEFMREVEISQALDHGNLVKFIKTFSIEGERHVIIMPFFPRSAADLLSQASVISLATIKVIARNCFDALCHLHSKGFCFVDLKPSNIMLQNAEQGRATLVDYGATVRIGSPIIEFTKQYCLDANTSQATEHLDWICLGTTLAQIGGFDICTFYTTNDLVNEVYRSAKNDNLKKLILSCLQSPSSSNIESALNQLE
jgi:hypothetical protein